MSHHSSVSQLHMVLHTPGQLSHALVLAPVAHPATVGISAHVAPVLSLPVAVHTAHSVATVPLVHLVDTVVAVPASLRVITSVAMHLSGVTRLLIRFKA